jgi:hypothetical protein
MRVTLVLDLGDTPGGMRRLRMALKTLWRAWRLKCVSIRPVDPEG